MSGQVERSIDGKILDERDQAIVEERMTLIERLASPRVGDYVLFADGTERRISCLWSADDGWEASVQTSDLGAGRYYLGRFGLRFSGSLHPGVSVETLTETDERRDGDAWIFHHDSHRADNDVEFEAPFRVYRCSLTPDEAERAFADVYA